MKTIVKSALILSAISTTLLASSAIAKTARLEVKVEVKNLFSADATEALDFGTLRVQGDATDIATMKIEADPALVDPEIANPGNAVINLIAPGGPGVIEISDAAPNTELTITAPASTTVNSVGNASFDLKDFEFYVVNGAQPNSEVTNNKFRVDETGVAKLSVGATLSTQALGSGTATYGSGSYDGKVEIEIAY
ncbi:DUF4402 domain-containing protein [Pseudoalteromonas piscicida]|uniref:DUF4402 domain-containing protein n=1 Tax=Pseudoalteromonas piscicida TaxID=43662 RepID=A0A2A5JUY9_PSEO7|nr:DUF4402 domain-containing protein [Pseudoalteromonas piscicida]PCK33255.1 hypothetical protein CEX98_02830 [Pseudoalteromonas piscicida]